jgi:hypothetical protein
VSKITDPKELGKALNNNNDTIEIEGDLVKKVVKIKKVNCIFFAICKPFLGIAFTFVISTLNSPASIVLSPVRNFIKLPISTFPALMFLGLKATMAAIFISLGAGNVKVLSTLRKYKLTTHSDSYATLTKVVKPQKVTTQKTNPQKITTQKTRPSRTKP